MSRLPHPSLLPAVPTPPRGPPPARPPRPRPAHPDRRTHRHRPRTVLAHARTAARPDPDTAAIVGYSTTTPLTLPAAAALLCSLHDPDELADMGLRLVRHITRTTAATRHRDPVVLELSDAPEEAGR
ncbi:hypothetical protein ACIOJG_35185 [Streptomyces anulatus]